jgi:hypothetical protein
MPLLTSLIAHWALDEASGNALDSHGSNDLSELDGTIASTTGKLGNCRDFEAADTEHFQINDNTDLSTGDIDFSFACWVMLESKPGGLMYIAQKGDATFTSGEWHLGWNNISDRFVFSVIKSPGTQTDVTANNFGAPSTGVWYFIECGHDSVNNQTWISVNGGTRNTAAHSAGVNDAGVSFGLGRLRTSSPVLSNYWDGLIDSASFWKKVLSTDEVQDLYNDGHGLDYANFADPDNFTKDQLLLNLVSWWPLDEFSGNAIDVHSSNTLTDTNTVAAAAGKVNGARDFEADNSEYLTIADNTSLSMGNIDFALAGWVYFESKGTNRALFGKAGLNNAVSDYIVTYNSVADRIQFVVSNGSGAGSAASASANILGSPSTATWYFIVAWHDSVTDLVCIQINGGGFDSASNTLGSNDTATGFAVGARMNATPDRFMDGLIDEVAVWKRRLKPWERRALYNSGNGITYPGPRGKVAARYLLRKNLGLL